MVSIVTVFDILVKFLLCYDFEMFARDNRGPASGDAVAKGNTSQGPVQAHEVEAFFCDQKTVDAITGAPPIVRLFLEESGFGLTIAKIDEENRPPALAALAMRRTLSDQLTMALSNRALKRALIRAAKVSEFNVADFIASVVSRNPDKQALEITVSDEFVVEEVPHFHSDVVPDAESDASQEDVDGKVRLRRPNQLRGKGIKSRFRPNYG